MANENSGLQSAKRNKKDEFYTQLVVVARKHNPAGLITSAFSGSD